MRTRIASLAVLGALLTGCSASSDLLAPGGSSLGKGVSAPNTSVGTNFVVYVNGTTFYRGDDSPSKNGKGLCKTINGTTGWYWVPGNVNRNGSKSPDQVNGPEHAQCKEVTPDYTITVSFAEVANYVKSTSGNYELNFASLCTPNADPLLPATCVSRYVHYKLTGDWSNGTGVLTGTGVSSLDGASSTWTIDLSQVNSSSNLISDPPRKLLVTAHNVEGAYQDSPATIAW